MCDLSLDRVKVVKAAPDDLASALKLSSDIFFEEQGIPKELDFIPDEKKPMWFCAKFNNDVVGTAVLYREGDEYHLGRVTVAEPMRGQNISARLIIKALDQAFDEGASEVHASARDSVVHIMGKLGGKVAGESEPFYEGNVTPVLISKGDYEAVL